MNKEYSRRRQLTRKAIEDEFLRQLEYTDLDKITVSGLCEAADINRGSFYRNYIDIYDLSDQIFQGLMQQVEEMYRGQFREDVVGDEPVFLRLFRHIKENQTLYRTCLKIHYDDNLVSLEHYDEDYAKRLYREDHIGYHLLFFKAGFNALIREWLKNDCRETPEEMMEFLKDEYRGKSFDI